MKTSVTAIMALKGAIPDLFFLYVIHSLCGQLNTTRNVTWHGVMHELFTCNTSFALVARKDS